MAKKKKELKDLDVEQQEASQVKGGIPSDPVGEAVEREKKNARTRARRLQGQAIQQSPGP
ncbi:MAG: hypothetical protein ACRDH6_02850 [Actinomycetota bacterium]